MMMAERNRLVEEGETYKIKWKRMEEEYEGVRRQLKDHKDNGRKIMEYENRLVMLSQEI